MVVLQGVELRSNPGQRVLMPFAGLVMPGKFIVNGVEHVRIASPWCEARFYGLRLTCQRGDPKEAGDDIGEAEGDRLGFTIINIDPVFLSKLVKTNEEWHSILPTIKKNKGFIK